MAGLESQVLVNTAGIVVSLFSMVVAVWRGVIWLDGQQKVRSKYKEDIELQKAADLRRYTDNKEEMLKQVLEKTATDLKNYNDAKSKEFLAILDDLNYKLTTRADMTNGNVANIRKDLLDLSNDIENLYYYNDTHKQDEEGNKGEADQRRRQQAKKRQQRYDQIESDRQAQHPPGIDRQDDRRLDDRRKDDRRRERKVGALSYGNKE